MIVKNNKARKAYLHYNVNGFPKKTLIFGYSQADISDLTDINQINFSSHDEALRNANAKFGSVFTGTFTITTPSSEEIIIPYWEEVGGGLDYYVYAINSSDDTLYMGGEFNTASGGTIDTKKVASWDGTNWGDVGGGFSAGTVYDIEIDGSDVYFVGAYLDGVNGGKTTINSSFVKWDGANWEVPGLGIPKDKYTYAVAVNGSDIYVGGSFFSVSGGTIPMSSITRWDGTNWNDVGGGINQAASSVYSLLVDGTDIYVGGRFVNVSGMTTPMSGISRWDGTNWNDVGGGLCYGGGITIVGQPPSIYVYEILKIGNDIYAGGRFDNMSAGTMTANNLAKWDGTNWESVGGGTDGTVYAMATDGTNLYVAGDFSTVSGGTISIGNLAKWDGVNWSDVGGTIDYYPNSLHVHDNYLYAGGYFNSVSGGTVSADKIAKYGPLS